MDVQSDDSPPPRRPIPRTRRGGPVLEAERETRESSGRAWSFAAFGALAGAALALLGAYMISPAPDLAGVSARLDALEAEAISAADQRRALADRLAAAETALRRAEAPPAAALPADARPLAALALRQRLAAGAPYAAELAVLDRLGAPADALAGLRRFAATGAPTRAALLTEARALLPPPESRLWGLVKPRKVGISHEAEAREALARDDLAAALTAFRAMPPQAQREAWARAAEAWLKADAAAQSLTLDAAAAPGR